MCDQWRHAVQHLRPEKKEEAYLKEIRAETQGDWQLYEGKSTLHIGQPEDVGVWNLSYASIQAMTASMTCIYLV